LINLEATLALRSRAVGAVRRFFAEREFIEVETPVRIAAPALEPHIYAEPSGDRYLRTSPELHMKRLIAKGYERIYQIGPCFRRGERGRRHNPEFTMLEWYRRDADYLDMLVDTKALVASVLEETLGTTTLLYQGREIHVMPLWDCLTVEEAFLSAAGWNVITGFDPDRFDVDLVDKVEPSLPADRPVVLRDYPVQAAGLARCKEEDPRLAERWELYIGGLELANAFSELTEPGEQRRRFEQCAQERRKAGEKVYPLDEGFLTALQDGMPPCGGVALGIDRLVMLITDADTIDAVRPFDSETRKPTIFPVRAPLRRL